MLLRNYRIAFIRIISDVHAARSDDFARMENTIGTAVNVVSVNPCCIAGSIAEGNAAVLGNFHRRTVRIAHGNAIFIRHIQIVAGRFRRITKVFVGSLKVNAFFIYFEIAAACYKLMFCRQIAFLIVSITVRIPSNDTIDSSIHLFDINSVIIVDAFPNICDTALEIILRTIFIRTANRNRICFVSNTTSTYGNCIIAAGACPSAMSNRINTSSFTLFTQCNRTVCSSKSMIAYCSSLLGSIACAANRRSPTSSRTTCS